MSNTMKLHGETLTASEYYYGVKPDFWDQMLYPEAIKDRADKARDLYHKLYKHMMATDDWAFEDQVRFHKVEKAHKDTKQILDERTLLI